VGDEIKMTEELETRVLIVEDEAHIAAGLKLNLELEGYTVDVAKTGREAGEFLLNAQRYGVIILDVMLPDTDGFTICRRLRGAGIYVPVIMLTAKASATDRVDGLDAGADDYIPKPFELSELLARVRSRLRRQAWDSEAQVSQERVFEMVLGPARINFDTYEVYIGDDQLQLTHLELDLLRYFAESLEAKELS
jgi:DNA-binding response OmpR family regulator